MGAISQSVGLFGATGELGRAFFDALEEQGAFVGRLRLFASERSSEETRLFRDKPLAVEVADDADFDDLNEAILAVPAEVADDLAARLLAAGVRVWDASGHLRAHPQAVKLAEAGPDSALVVLADQLVSTWADSHLFLGWVTDPCRRSSRMSASHPRGVLWPSWTAMPRVKLFCGWTTSKPSRCTRCAA